VPHYANRLAELIGYFPDDFFWFERAFTHPSFHKKDNSGRYYNYDRLEFLGDSVLALIVSELIFNAFKDANEGELSEIRSKIVSRKNLNEIGRKLHLKQFFGKHSRKQLGENLEGNALEALIGAIYMDKGFEQAKKFVEQRIVGPYMDLRKIRAKISSYKNEMTEWAQKHKKTLRFTHSVETDTRNKDVYFVNLYVDNRLAGRGRGHSRKKAEETASKNAYRKLVK